MQCSAVSRSAATLAFATSRPRTPAPARSRYATVQGDPTLCPPTPLVPGGLTGTGTPATVPVGAPPGTPVPIPFPAFCYSRAADQSFASGGGTAEHGAQQFPQLPAELQLARRPVAEVADPLRRVEGDFAAGHRVCSRTTWASRMNLPTGRIAATRGGSLGRTASPIGVNPTYTANGYNPYLRPTERVAV